MKVATYNVNGVNGRLPVLLRWLAERQPDVVVLQELKAPQDRFPEGPIRDLGYEAIWHGQKSWNGVAMLSRVGEIHETRRGLPGDPDDTQSRYIEAAVAGILIGGLYMPNGNPRPGPKFDYKMRWFEKLIEHAAELLESGFPVMLAGDFNVMPTERDVYKPERWLDDALFAPEVRKAFFRLTGQGWTDALRAIHPDETIYTFFDYFRNAYARNAGLRIDHLLLSPALAERLVDAQVDRDVRGWEKTSDHAPVWIERSDKPKRKRRMTDKLHPLAGTEPMEAKLVDALPAEDGWQYEPKWDGFRAIASRSGKHVELMSKSGKSLARYFPEIVAALRDTACDDYVLDGELILPIDGVLSFDALQARLHPAESRIRRLSAETPAQLMLFDCLAVDGRPMIDRPLAHRRAALERFHGRDGTDTLRLSPRAEDIVRAEAWLAVSGGALDGVIAKRRDEAYRSGDRAMLKVKRHRTADCVVGGFRRAKDGQLVASLLLGLYDYDGLLNHVGFTSALAKQDRTELTARLEALVAPPGFTGKAPGGPSRWNDGKESEWFPLKPELVVEVSYDRVTSDRFRHGTGLVRWRPDKAPRQCRMEQLGYSLRPSDLADVG